MGDDRCLGIVYQTRPQCSRLLPSSMLARWEESPDWGVVVTSPTVSNPQLTSPSSARRRSGPYVTLAGKRSQVLTLGTSPREGAVPRARASYTTEVLRNIRRQRIATLDCANP